MCADKTGRAYKEIGLQLKVDIERGKYQIGDRLPPERDIAEQLSVSRTIVREAIIMLELEGMVIVKKGSGVYVTEKPGEQDSARLLESDHGPFEMLQARQLLESNIAEFAAAQATPSDIAKLRSALSLEKKELNDQSEAHEGDRLFHLALAEATQNSALVKLFNVAWQMRNSSSMWKKLHTRIIDNDYRGQWIDDHAAVFEAVRRKDPAKARHAMWQHLENVKERLMALSDVDDPDFDGFQFQSSPIRID